MTEGWPIRCMSSPRPRPTTIKSMTWAMNMNSEGCADFSLAASATPIMRKKAVDTWTAAMRREHAREDIEVALVDLRIDQRAGGRIFRNSLRENLRAPTGPRQRLTAPEFGDNERGAAGGDAGAVVRRQNVIRRQRA